MKLTSSLFLLLLALDSSAGDLVDRIVAVVGKEIITLSDVRAAERYGRKDPLESLIREKILALEMDRLGIQTTDDDLADAIRQVLARNQMSLEQLKTELTAKQTSFEEYKGQLRQEVRKMKFLGQVVVPRIRISEEEIAAQLDSNPTEEERLRIRQKIVESRLGQELENYLDEVRQKTFVEIKK